METSYVNRINSNSDVENDDESVEYEYEDAEQGLTATTNGPVAQDAVAGSASTAVKNFEDDTKDDEGKDDDWSCVSEDESKESSDVEIHQRNEQYMPHYSEARLKDGSVSSSSSWSLLPKMKALSTNSANISGSKKKGQSNSSVISALSNGPSIECIPGELHKLNVDEFSLVSHHMLNEDTKQLRSNELELSGIVESDSSSFVTNDTKRSNLANTLPHITFHPPGQAMVRCLRCTMDNFPGAQVCQVCELPITANPTTDLDREIAYRITRNEEEGGIQDIQALLLDGKTRTRAVVNGETATSIQYAHSLADNLLIGIQGMKKTLRSAKACNVIESIDKDTLVRNLVKLHEQFRGNLPHVSLGFILTSRSCEDVLKNGFGENSKSKVICARSKFTHPWRQLKIPDENLMDFVWLVLLGGEHCISHDHYELGIREMETVPFKKCRGVKMHLILDSQCQVVVPLVCTANANLAIPFRTKTTPEGSGMLAKAYREALDRVDNGLRPR